jgi:hypothetical protein
MPDFLKKASKRTSDICADDEPPLAALFCRPRQGDKSKRLGTPGGALSKVSKLADSVDQTDPDVDVDASHETTDQRDFMFGQNAILVLTQSRLLAFGHGTYTGRVKPLSGEVTLADIASLDLEAPPVGQSGASSLAIEFADGYKVLLTPGSRRRRFVEAFETTRQPA